MEVQSYIHITGLRFRRWARGKYAAFASIGKNVSIGCLAAKLCDSSMVKKTGLCVEEFPFLKMTSLSQEENEGGDLSTILVLDLSFGGNNTDKVAVAPAYISYFIDQV